MRKFLFVNNQKDDDRNILRRRRRRRNNNNINWWNHHISLLLRFLLFLRPLAVQFPEIWFNRPRSPFWCCTRPAKNRQPNFIRNFHFRPQPQELFVKWQIYKKRRALVTFIILIRWTSRLSIPPAEAYISATIMGFTKFVRPHFACSSNPSPPPLPTSLFG